MLSHFETIRCEQTQNILSITLDQPESLNALSMKMIQEINQVLDMASQNAQIHVVTMMGCEKAFAAGINLKEAADVPSFYEAYQQDLITVYEKLSGFRKPVIMGLSGYVFGGGMELALMGDILIAAENTVIGQPELSVGTIPGIGATQRLTKLIGKARTMDMVLSNRKIDAKTALEWGVVSRVVPLTELKNEVMAIAQKVDGFSLPLTMLAKEAIQFAENSPLTQGIQFERRLFQATFALQDRSEGMQAFMEKRKPDFKNQ